ncbi:hypothetical protein WKW80_02740 [Variovorax humicola]|uniref:Uncharacterized protein n=1 Tax=Variovorax humicola TaxID=1769758 RepID=A0ABU8VTI7_9BURK
MAWPVEPFGGDVVAVEAVREQLDRLLRLLHRRIAPGPRAGAKPYTAMPAAWNTPIAFCSSLSA